MTAAAVRTLWVTNDFPPRSGGIEQFVANLLRLQDPSTVRVVTSRHPDADHYDASLAYEVIRAARRPLLPTPRLARRVCDEADRFGAHLIVFGASWPLAELARALPLPSVALTHGHEAGMVKVGGGPLIRHALRGVNGIGVISDYTRQALVPWAPATTDVHFVPPGVDVHRFSPEVSGAAVRERFGVAPAAPLVLCLSRLVARKGQDVLIEAWPSVVHAVGDARLLIAGGGPLERSLRRRVASLGLGASVLFAGDVPSKDLPVLHAAADVFAMPCRTRALGLDVEGLGIVYLEAQASGTPVIAGTSGGAPEAIVDGETGRVVDGRDVAGLAAALTTLLQDPERRQAMGAAGRRFAVERYSWEAIGQRFDALLRAAANRGD